MTLNIDAIKNWLSEREPLEYRIAIAKGPTWYSLVVPDPSRLPPDVGKVKECDQLRVIGLAAGGVQSDFSNHRVLLRGIAQDGVVITDMRAKITKRAPAADGALLFCPPAGSMEPIGLAFDLTNSDSAPAQRYDPNSDKKVNQFTDGFAISVAHNESIPLMVETMLPDDSIEWHIEADVLVGGARRTIVIDNEGKDFYSPGMRLSNQYREGHGAGVVLTNWGVDKSVRRVTGPDGADALRLGPVLVPYSPHLDIYQPGLSDAPSDGDSPYRWVRYEGRRILTFNPPGVPARALPTVGDPCRQSGPYGEDVSGGWFGFVRIRTIISSEVRTHGGRQFEHSTIDYKCNTADGSYQRDGNWLGDQERSRLSSTADYWKCGGVLCPEKAIRLHTARMIGSDIIFTLSSNEIANQDQALAERILAEVQINP